MPELPGVAVVMVDGELCLRQGRDNLIRVGQPTHAVSLAMLLMQLAGRNAKDYEGGRPWVEAMLLCRILCDGMGVPDLRCNRGEI